MPDNPELLDGLKFENGTSSGSGDLSQKRRTDCKRRLSDRPEHGKSKISRDNHHPRSSQYVENQVMVKSPSCWIDPFKTKRDRRRITELTSTAGSMLRDVIELNQAALWHGGKIRIDRACEAAAESMVRQPKALRISFRPNEVRDLSGTHQEHTKPLQTSYSAPCISSPSAVELSQMSGGTCQEQSSTDASDSSMCGSNCASRLERASSSDRKISQGKSNFPLASIPAVDIYRSHSFYSSVVSDDSGRDSPEETTGSARDKRSTPISKSGTTSCGKEKIPQPETFTHSDTSNHRSRTGSVQTTTNGRLGNADLGLSTSNRTKSVSRECISGMDDVSAVWGTLESEDGPGRHPGEDVADNRSTSIDTSLSRMCIKDAITTDGEQNVDFLRMQSVSPVQYEWCTRLILWNHVFRCLRIHVLQLSPWRSQ